jgi:hypothetical protein
MIYQLTSVNTVISKIVRDLGLGDKEIPYQDFIEWIADALKHIGSYYQFTEKATQISINNYKGELPCDCYKVIRMLDGFYYQQNNEHIIINPDSITIDEDIANIKITNMDFNVTHNIITTSYKTGVIDIQYLAIPIDQDGFPMIPDDISFFEALFWRVTYMLCLQGYEFKNTQLRDINFTRSKWNFYCMQARGNANMPDLDILERLKNIWLTLKPNVNAYAESFQGVGRKQNINLGGKE